jgi:hypothetical protein
MTWFILITDPPNRDSSRIILSQLIFNQIAEDQVSAKYFKPDYVKPIRGLSSCVSSEAVNLKSTTMILCRFVSRSKSWIKMVLSFPRRLLIV